jgi:hypothetical protein
VNPITPATSDDLTGNITPTNYTATSSDTLSTHLSAIDSALGSAGGGGASAPSVNPSTITTSDVTLSAPSSGVIEEIYTINNSSTAITVTLQPASTCGSGFKYGFKALGSANITIDANSTETIDGSLTYVISQTYEALTIVCDGSNWHII